MAIVDQQGDALSVVERNRLESFPLLAHQRDANHQVIEWQKVQYDEQWHIGQIQNVHSLCLVVVCRKLFHIGQYRYGHFLCLPAVCSKLFEH